MAMLQTIQRFCRRTNISVPTSVIGTTDTQVAQIYALLEEEISDLADRGTWQALTLEATHTTLNAESQGAITSIASDGFQYIKNQTIWDRTENLPVIVIDGPDWQSEKGFANTAPRYMARIRAGLLLVTPDPVAGNTWAFEYVTQNAILDTNGSTRKQYFTADTDTFLLDEAIITMGLRWRWKKEKGFDYAEDFRTYEKKVENALSRQGLQRIFYQDRGDRTRDPHIILNQGNWPLP